MKRLCTPFKTGEFYTLKTLLILGQLGLGCKAKRRGFLSDRYAARGDGSA